MRRISPFRVTLLAGCFAVTSVLVMAVGSLFLVADWNGVAADLASEEMRFAVQLSLWTGTLSTLLVMLAAMPMGYALSRLDFPGKIAVRVVLDLPVAFPELVLGLCLLLLFGQTPFGNALKAMGLDFVFSLKGLIAAQFFTALPYAVRIMKSTFDYISPRLEFVTRSLGYNQAETFMRVSLPLARSGILAATIIAFARCIGAFGSVLILAGGSYLKTETLPIALYLNISYGNLGMAMSCGMVLVVISFIAIYVFERTESSL